MTQTDAPMRLLDTNEIEVGISLVGDRSVAGNCPYGGDDWSGGTVVLRATVSRFDLLHGPITLSSTADDAFPVRATFTLRPGV